MIQPQRELPVPSHYDPDRVDEIWRVEYEARSQEARAWAAEHGIGPSAGDDPTVCLLAIDMQNTFCMPEFALFVGGQSGRGAVDDADRLCTFVYRHLGRITRIVATMDTHRAVQIFHPAFLIDEDGGHPSPHTSITAEDVAEGRWRFNDAVAPSLGIRPEDGQRHLQHYADVLSESDRYDLTVWPYHAMLGGIGHALLPAFEEAVFFHGRARNTQAELVIKGDNPLTEAYSAVGPEVTRGPDGQQIARRNEDLLELIAGHDVIVIAGQAKSHCVAWTVQDLLTAFEEEPERFGTRMAQRLYLLEDCSSPVVVPDGPDFTDAADAAFDRFAEAGAHIVRSTTPMSDWPSPDVG